MENYETSNDLLEYNTIINEKYIKISTFLLELIEEFNLEISIIYL
jgi:hypothetical protein